MPPHPPHLHPHDWGRWQPPLPTERDLQLLQELLGSADEARAVFRLLVACPPEVAAVGGLVLRLFERLQPLMPAEETQHGTP